MLQISPFDRGELSRTRFRDLELVAAQALAQDAKSMTIPNVLGSSAFECKEKLSVSNDTRP